MPRRILAIALLLALESRCIPVARQHIVARKHRTELWAVEAHAFELTRGHDHEERPERRARHLDGAVVEVALGHALMSGAHVVHAVGEDLHVLGLGPKHLVGEDRMRMGEDTSEKHPGELRGDPVAKSCGQDPTTVPLDVLTLLKVAVGNEERRFALVGAHARPDFGDEQADVVIDTRVGSDMSGRRDERRLGGERMTEERCVQVDDRRQGVERPFRKRAFRSCSGRRRGLPGHRADELHQQLGELHVVNRVVNGQRTDLLPGFRWVVAATRNDRVDRREQRGVGREPTVQPGGDPGQIGAAGVGDVRPDLQVPRVLRRLAVDQAWVGRGHEERGSVLAGGSGADQLLHRCRERGEADSFVGKLDRVGLRQRLEVRDEIARLRQLKLGELVVAAEDRIVGALEQLALTVFDEFA